MSDLVKRLAKFADAMTVNGLPARDKRQVPLKTILDAKAELERLTAALSMAEIFLAEAKNETLRNLNGDYDYIKTEYYNKGLEDAAKVSEGYGLRRMSYSFQQWLHSPELIATAIRAVKDKPTS